MKKTSSVIAIIILTSVLYGWREEYCSEEKAACMIMEGKDSRVAVLFHNKLPLEKMVTTVTLEVKPGLVNMKGRDRFPLTRIVRGPEPVELTALTIVDPARAWNSNLYYYWQYGEPASGKEKETGYRLPFEAGKKYRVCQAFNGRVSHFAETRYAVDFLMPIGTPVHAARDGVVIATEDRQEEGKLEAAYRTKSNFVLIQHDDGTVGRYYHLVKSGVKVAVGQSVKAGDRIGLSGNSGYSDVPHLHFEVSRPVDGKSKYTIPFTFITDYGDRDVPVEGAVYADNGLSRKSRTPVPGGEIVLCRSVKDLKPVDIIDSISAEDEVIMYLPIDILGVHVIKLQIFSEHSQGPALVANWQTGKTWWYTSYTFKGRDLKDGPGKFRAEISVNSQLVRTLEFTLE